MQTISSLSYVLVTHSHPDSFKYLDNITLVR